MPPQLSPSPLYLIISILFLSLAITSAETFYYRFSQDSENFLILPPSLYPVIW